MQGTPFKQGYAPKWTRELFVVRGHLPTTMLTYEHRDEMGEPMKGKLSSRVIRKNLTAGSTRLTSKMAVLCQRISRFLEILTMCQIVAAELVVDRSRQGTVVHARWCGFWLHGAEYETQMCQKQQQQW